MTVLWSGKGCTRRGEWKAVDAVAAGDADGAYSYKCGSEYREVRCCYCGQCPAAFRSLGISRKQSTRTGEDALGLRTALLLVGSASSTTVMVRSAVPGIEIVTCSLSSRTTSAPHSPRLADELTTTAPNLPQALSEEPSDLLGEPTAEKIRSVSDFAPIRERVRKYVVPHSAPDTLAGPPLILLGRASQRTETAQGHCARRMGISRFSMAAPCALKSCSAFRATLR